MSSVPTRNVEGFVLPVDAETGAFDTSGDSPATTAVNEALAKIMKLIGVRNIDHIFMMAPGLAPRYRTDFPHSRECEARLLEAAEHLRLALQALMQAKEAQ